MPAYIKKTGGTWSSAISAFYIKSSTWRTISAGYIKVAGAWRPFFTSTLTPSIAFPVEISRNNATYPSTLTGTNYHWTNSTSLTYVFQKSSDNVNFTNIGSSAVISNPSSGSSNTVTYALTLSDFPAFTSYFRFVVTAVNSTFSTSATSTSSSVSVNRPAPINTVAPTISPTSGTVGVTTYSVTSNGTWDPVDADGVYQYLWQSFDTPTYVSAPGTNNLSTYTPPSDFLSSGYQSPIRCRVTAVNASGSTDAFSNTATVSAVTPSASNLATADTTITPGAPSSITVANTATINQGQVTWTNGSSATSAWVSSVTPGSSFTGSDGGSLLTSQLFTITSSATAVATVNNKNNNKRVTVSWNQANAASYRVSYTITNAGLANGTFNQDGNSTASSASFTVTLGNVSGTVRANSVTVYSSANQSGVSSTFTPGSLPSTSPTDKTSSNTGSGSVTFTPAAPVNTVAPTIAPTSGTAGSTTYSVTSVGSWTNSPTSYAYLWQAFDSPTYISAPGTNNLSTYTPPPNFFTLGYSSPIRCRVTASNAGGSAAAFSNTASVSAPVSIPSGGTVTLSGSSTPGSVITASTSGWSGSPTSYDVYITTALSPTVPTSGSTRVASSGGGSSTTYTITSSDAIAPVNIFRAFATASNSAGTSSTVQSSNTITATAAAGAVPVLISLTGNNSLPVGGTFSWSFSNSPTAYSLFVTGPTGTVYTTSNAYTYSTTTFRPGYDGTGWQGSGNYNIYVSARNSTGDSLVASLTTFMS